MRHAPGPFPKRQPTLTRFNAFGKQVEFLTDTRRVVGAFAGKRGGKTEVGAVRGLMYSEQLRGYDFSPIDPYLGMIIAPTDTMLRRLSLKKFYAYSKNFMLPGAKGFNTSRSEMRFLNGAEVYGISADKPERMEGLKANWGWIDEVFQVKEQVYLEAIARVSDTGGDLWCTGSLGVQYKNPKAHWAYRHFKEAPNAQTGCHEWGTADNPYFSRSEITRLQANLDAATFKQMFLLSWDSPGTSLVYDTLTDENVIAAGYTFRPELPVMISIDWGWAHPMAVGFYQYDHARDELVLFDEIVESRLSLDNLWLKIQKRMSPVSTGGRGYRITEWFCDIAGTQEREQTGRSNVAWFKSKGVEMKYRTSAVTYGVTLVRAFLCDGLGRRRFLLCGRNVPKHLDALRNYSYPEKDGILVNENPLKVQDDPCDSVRYLFVNKFDRSFVASTIKSFDRWGLKA